VKNYVEMSGGILQDFFAQLAKSLPAGRRANQLDNNEEVD